MRIVISINKFNKLEYYQQSRMFGPFLLILMLSSGWGLRSLKSPLQRTSFTRCHLVSELQQVASESILLTSNIDTSSLMQSEVEQQVQMNYNVLI